MHNKKQLAATLSVSLNCFLIVMKLVVGLLSGSVAVLASAIDSGIDLVASIFTFMAVRIASEPPDADHPFGHGKFEDVSGLAEAVLIIVGALFIVSEVFQKLFSTVPETIQTLPGIIVMSIALVLDWLVSRYILKVSIETGSPALYADAHHLSTDVWTSLAIIAGLLLVEWTGIKLFDPLLALIVAGMILWIGFQIIRKVFQSLVDTALPALEVSDIERIIHETMGTANGTYTIVDLKTRRSGTQRVVVFNLRVNPDMSVSDAHALCDKIEMAIEQAYPETSTTIHLEPLLDE